MKKKTDIKFETALGRLEKIVDVLESGDSELDDSLKLFEEGIGLIRTCQNKLDDVKGKIKILKKKGDKLVPELFDGDYEE